MGRMVDDERMERWCRMRAEKKVVDEGIKRIVENEKRLIMVQDERIERTPYGWEMEMVIVDERMERWRKLWKMGWKGW
jgi:hypothetical protein